MDRRLENITFYFDDEKAPEGIDKLTVNEEYYSKLFATMKECEYRLHLIKKNDKAIDDIVDSNKIKRTLLFIERELKKTISEITRMDEDNSEQKKKIDRLLVSKYPLLKISTLEPRTKTKFEKQMHDLLRVIQSFL